MANSSPPWPTPSLVVVGGVREGVHALIGGEGAVEVGEDVVHGECNELASTPKNTAEEVVGVEGVGEPHDEPDSIAIVTDLFDSKHDRRAPREVAVAGGEEELGQPPCAPPPRHRPHS